MFECIAIFECIAKKTSKGRNTSARAHVYDHTHTYSIRQLKTEQNAVLQTDAPFAQQYMGMYLQAAHV